MVVGSQDAPVVVKGILISVWLDKVFTGGPMPAQENNNFSLFRFGVGFPRLPRRGREVTDFSVARPSSHWRGHASTVKTNHFFLFRLGGGLPGVPMRGQEDPEFGLARQSFHSRGHARTMKKQ